MYSSHLFLISLLLLGPYHFCLLSNPSLHECCLGISKFLEEISSLSHSLVFLYFFSLIAEEGFLISSCYSLELCIQMLISFLINFSKFRHLWYMFFLTFTSFHIFSVSHIYSHFLLSIHCPSTPNMSINTVYY